ncbi:MarR family winged helix-turn-helix transcriptional regulator [Actinomadura oligospora]|uniref:MarR family winged helix-turn-helix transcriptional regulator n=1 Tax=Actinomadura oligospora TaxID=111804 RepID=UPI0004B1E3F4|nr:MarR family winged helix-turn-helix transcriptional regulator [Actinomadura oligospora]
MTTDQPRPAQATPPASAHGEGPRDAASTGTSSAAEASAQTTAAQPAQGPPVGVAFLLAQLGSHAAALFAERIGTLDLTPPQAGLLRMLKASPGCSQRELADRLGMPPSRFVPFVDTMEERGLVERRRNPDDRRLHALYLTEAGESLLNELRSIAMAHEADLASALSPEEHRQLTGLLQRIAADRDLTPGVHPGYRSVRPR